MRYKKKIALTIAAALISMGVRAQHAEYFDFPTEITDMEEITSASELTDGMQIVIKHNHEATEYQQEGEYVIINSDATTGQSYHTMAMDSRAIGLAMFTLEGDANDGFKLKTIHNKVSGLSCYVGLFGESSMTTTTTEYGDPAVINFEYTDYGFYITSLAADGTTYCLSARPNAEGEATLTSVAASTRPLDFEKYAAFKVYKVKKTYGTTKYVENATVKLTGQGGNTITGVHSGWSDFYEFVTDGQAYGCELSNVRYDEANNIIYGNVNFPFAVSGDYMEVPVYLNASANTGKRVSIVDGALKVVDNEEGDENLNSQWYIYPKIEGLKISYAIKNVGTGQYIYHTDNSTSISLSDEAAYFDLTSNAAEEKLRFTFKYFKNNYTYTSYLYNSSGSIISGDYSWAGGSDFLVPTVKSIAQDLGFIQKYPTGNFFWNAGALTTYPEAVNAMLISTSHEGYDSGEHQVYSVETAIKLNQRNNVVVTFKYDEGIHRLNIFGVDIVNKDGVAFLFDYHLGMAGNGDDYSSKYVYTLENVPPGEYTLRYFVCNSEEGGHNLDRNAGTIIVDGASRRLKISDAPENGAWAANTTWYVLNQGDSYYNIINAQPAYTDWYNNLTLTNDTRSTDAAGLWCIVGNETDGYLLYNRAWGVDYALQTVGNEENARTSMQEVANATRYDLVLHEYDTTSELDKGQWFIRVHGTEAEFLNDRDGYLAKWNHTGAYSANGSVMTFHEVLLGYDDFDANLVPVQDELEKLWAPWTICPEIDEAYNLNSDFASWVWGRQKLAGLLDGTVFKFTNKAGDDRSDKVLGINEAGSEIIGFDATKNTTNDYVRLAHKGYGKYTLYSLSTGKYFGDPGVAADDASSATHYTYKVYNEEKHALAFVTGDQMLHLGDWTHSYVTIDYNVLDDDASRWNVTFNEVAQELAELIDEVNARYEEVMQPAYQANVGVPGYADAVSTESLYSTVYGGLYNTTLAEAAALLNNAMANVDNAEKKVFFPTDCYFTLTNERGSLVYDENQEAGDATHNGSDYLWYAGMADKNNPAHLWGFYLDEETNEYYLYNVGKVQFANSKGNGSYGGTWIFSDSPVAITMESLDAPYFHIVGAGKTMSISTSYVGPVITYYAEGDGGVPFQFAKSEVAVSQEVLDQVGSLLYQQVKPGFYMFKCGDDLYLNDKQMQNDTRRTITALTANKIDNIFYYTDDDALVGYASGFGFVYGHCNTKNPADGYNTFTFKTSYDPEMVFLKADQGMSIQGWADRYLTVNNGILVENSDKRQATSWMIEEVTELPVKFNNGGDGYAYATLYTPVALSIPSEVEAYTGVVEGRTLVLTQLENIIPAGTGVVLRTAAGAATYYFEITDSDLECDESNVLKGDVFTQLRNGKTYYSLANESGIAFYKYVGENLSGFRARISGDDVDTTQPLTFSFRNTTGIEEVTPTLGDEVIYDLSGRRVASPVKGLYIVNGKKVFIK